MIKREDVLDYFREHDEMEIRFLPRELSLPKEPMRIVSLIGPRRAGKTYLFLHLAKTLSNSLYLNFEDTRLMEINFREIREVIRLYIEEYGKQPERIFLDEVQNIERWEAAVRELHDMRKHKLYVTGSSSKLLSKEIATSLRGRTISFILLPLSFREYLNFTGFGKPKTRDSISLMKSRLMDYLEYGGFPEVVMSDEKDRILREYSELILFRDFIERHRIRKISLARAIYSAIMQSMGCEISIKRLHAKIGAIGSKNTVYEYVDGLEDTVFFFFLRKFSTKAHLRELWPKKVYLCDTGLSRIVRHSPDYGKLMENVVFTDLVRQTNTSPLLEIFYFKGQNYEVDFVIKDRNRIAELIQVTYASARDEIGQREIRALLKASSLLRTKNLKVITWDYEDEEKREGKKIRFIPLWKWLSDCSRKAT